MNEPRRRPHAGGAARGRLRVDGAWLAALAAALALANLAFHAWSAGWLAPLFGLSAAPDAVREPGRLARQVRPEAVRVLRPGEAPPDSTASAAEAPVSCLEAGPFNPDEARAAERLLAAALGEGGWSRRLAAGAGWEIVLGPYPGDAARERKRAQLARTGVAFEELAGLPAAMPGFSLGRHDTPQAAAAALAEARRHGVRSARVVAVGDVTSVWLRIDAADAAARDRLAPLGQRFGACEAR